MRNEEFTISFIENRLGEPSQKTGNIVIAAPNSGYAMHMRYGELPFHVLEANETPFALVFDEHYNRNGALSPEVWYGRNIGCYVRSSRVLSDPEKSWLNTRCNRNDLRHRRSLGIFLYKSVFLSVSSISLSSTFPPSICPFLPFVLFFYFPTINWW